MIAVYIALVVLAFFFMEFMAWFSHKYVMHGFLWVLHKDHHAPHKKRFERNDSFAVIFAVPSFLGIYLGLRYENNFFLSIGIGILLYGIAYFLFHDGVYHQRLKVKRPKNKYFRAIIKAHDDHHIGKKNYGFLLLVPFKYFRAEYKAN
jgi:beta-carotene 3-hydroxylase